MKYLKYTERILFRVALILTIVFCLKVNNQAQVIPVRLSTSFPYITITRNGLGTTSTTGLSLTNSTAAALGAQQYSPSLCFNGQGWKTTATNASQLVTFCLENQPVQGSTAPSGNLLVKASIAGGAFTTVGTFTYNSGTPYFLAPSLAGASVRDASANTRISLSSNTVINLADGTGPTVFTALSMAGDVILNGSAVTYSSGFGAGSPVPVGNASFWNVTVGSGGDTSGVVTFATAFTNTPHCFATNKVSAALVRCAATTSGATVSGVMLANDVIDVFVVGHYQ